MAEVEDAHHQRHRTGSTVPILLPRREAGPLGIFGRRLGLAAGTVVLVAALAYLGREGYADADGDGITPLDALYYATVSVTTTGYGDVRPESQTARLLTVLFVTPARILFLILLVGTTLEILAERTREAFEIGRWRRRLHDHVIICGYGTKGRAAVQTLLARGREPDQIVVIDEAERAVVAARSAGLAVVQGNASSVAVLEEAGIATASAVVVAPDRDDASVLTTLTARELNPRATIVAAVREEENAHLLRQSGADSVITSSSAAGRLLGLATHQPRVVEVLEDLLSVGEGLDIVERVVEPSEEGPLADLHSWEPVLAVVRDGELCRFDDPRVETLRAGDRVVQLCSNRIE